MNLLKHDRFSMFEAFGLMTTCTCLKRINSLFSLDPLTMALVVVGILRGCNDDRFPFHARSWIPDVRFLLFMLVRWS